MRVDRAALRPPPPSLTPLRPEDFLDRALIWTDC